MQSEYELELNRVARAIKKQKASRVLIQLPDGLKPLVTEIADELRKLTGNKAEIMIWFGSCYGACDIPHSSNLEKDIDLLVQFGHSGWKGK